MCKNRILFVDDDETLAMLVCDYMTNEGFVTFYAGNGNEALALMRKELPDLVLLDITMPGKDGYEVFKEIKADMFISNIPIVMMTAKSHLKDKIFGLDMGVDDYITKPYDIEELIARVKMVLKRTAVNMNANPLTKLPGNTLIENIIVDRITKKEQFAVLYIDINDFKPYNDHYGFLRGDQVIRSTARVLMESLKEFSPKNDFIGHIGGDDFILVTTPDKVERLCKSIISKFESMTPSLYDDIDRGKGTITTKDRQGTIRELPFLSLAIGIVTTEQKQFSSIGEVAKIGSELKSFAKKYKSQGSKYVSDKRKPSEQPL